MTGSWLGLWKSRYRKTRTPNLLEFDKKSIQQQRTSSWPITARYQRSCVSHVGGHRESMRRSWSVWSSVASYGILNSTRCATLWSTGAGEVARLRRKCKRLINHLTLWNVAGLFCDQLNFPGRRQRRVLKKGVISQKQVQMLFLNHRIVILVRLVRRKGHFCVWKGFLVQRS